MAVGRISGQLLKSNLLRNGVNLAFETDLLYIDVNNSRIGVNTASPQYPLDINGTARTTNLEVTTQAVINNITIGANSISTTASSLNITSPDGILYNNKLLIDDMEISGNTIKAMDSNQNFEIITSGTGIVEVFGDTRVNGNIHATGNIRADGNIQIGDADTDSISIAADFTSNITPDVTDTYNMGSAAKRWNDVYANNLIVDNLTLNGNITVQGLDLTARPGKIYYVATNGDDAKTGTHQNDPFATVSKALTTASDGDLVYIYPGTYNEVLPLTIPAGVSVRGDGIRAVVIKPHGSTPNKDVFILNGETTVEDLTIADFYYNSGATEGHAFRLATGADSTYFQLTSDIPLIKNVAVITKGSVTSGADPRGFDQGDAGKGAFLDGQVVGGITPEVRVRFQNCTFITPGMDAITVTNGVRVDFINSFTYFANKGINVTDGSYGQGGDGKTRVNITGLSGSFPAPSETVTYYDKDGATKLAEGTIETVDAGNNLIVLDGKIGAFALPTTRPTKKVTATGTTIDGTTKKYGSGSFKQTASSHNLKVAGHTDFGFGTGNFQIEGWLYPTSVQSKTLFKIGSLEIDILNNLSLIHI